jgi:hypothetical protein
LALSRQFKALGKIGAVFAGAWGLVGTALSVLAGGGIVPSLLSYGVMFGAAGGISGIATALLAARGEAGRAVEDVSSWRAALWGFLGGFIPAALLTAIVLIEGAGDVVAPLLVLGTISGGVGGAVCGIAAASAKRVEAPSASNPERLKGSG